LALAQVAGEVRGGSGGCSGLGFQRAEVKLLPRRLRCSGLAALRSAIGLPPEEDRLCPRGLGKWADVRARAERPRRFPAALRVLKELVLSARAGADS
jgi:hypothetical protein